MTTKPADATAVAPEAVLRLLRQLARNGAHADPSSAGVVLVISPGRPDMPFPRATIDAALVSRLIAPASDSALRITGAGRTHLKRMLSRSAATPAASPDQEHPGARPTFNDNESPLVWLARRQHTTGATLISPAQLAAGERFRADFWFAGMSPSVTTRWSESGSSSRSRKSGGACPAEQTDAMLAARQRIGRALDAVGPELSGILIDVCGHLMGLEAAERGGNLPKRSAKVILGLALTALARHYGLIVTAPRADATRARHWGAPGYRPPVDVDLSGQTG